MYFQYDANGIPLGFFINDIPFHYITNQMGDVIALTDYDGNVFAEYVYDEWGQLLDINTIEDGDWLALAFAEANPIRYRGYYYDIETGYYYLQSRYYDPSIGRFINADAPEIAQVSKDIPNGVNAFTYCNNNPVNNIDPFGYKSVSVAWISTPIDIAIGIFCSGAAISFDVISFGLKAAAKKFGWKKAYNILKGIFPAVKGIYSKFYTAIRKVAYKVAAKTMEKNCIEYCTKDN